MQNSMKLKTGVRFFILLLLLPMLFNRSCVNNNEEDLYGIVPCDTTNITWSSTISGILQNNCVGCHGTQVAYGGIRYDTYQSAMIVVQDGRLRGAVNHRPGFSKMPKDRGKLPECELTQMNIWLDNNAPEY